MCITEQQVKDIFTGIKELKLLYETMDIRIENLENKNHKAILKELMSIKEDINKIKYNV